MFPPHLPPPSCDLETHRRLSRLKTLLAAAIFGLVAGMSGASMILGWIWPGYGGGDVWSVSQTRTTLTRSQLEDKIQKEMADRVVAVYSQETLQGGLSIFDPADKLGDAVIISSDGYLAMMRPRQDGSWKNWRVLSADGSVYRLEKIMTDSRANLLYLKIAVGTGAEDLKNTVALKVVSFTEKITVLDELYALEENNWRYGWVQNEVPVRGNHLDTAPSVTYRLSQNFAAGAVVINGQGRLVGFIGGDGTLLPGYHVSRLLAGILSAGTVRYPSLGVEGAYSNSQKLSWKGEPLTGFSVSKVTAKKSKVLRGDVITEINGYVASADNLWYNIFGKDTARLKIWRAGKILEVDQPVINL